MWRAELVSISYLANSQRGEGEVKGDTCFMPTLVFWKRVGCGWCNIPSYLLALSGLPAERCGEGLNSDLWADMSLNLASIYLLWCTDTVLLKDMSVNFHMAADNACTETEVSRSENTEGSDLRTRKRKSSTHRQGGTWWGRFLWACTAWGGSRWRRILPQPLTGQPCAGRERTAWLSVSPNGQKEREKRLDNALKNAQFNAISNVMIW